MNILPFKTFVFHYINLTWSQLLQPPTFIVYLRPKSGRISSVAFNRLTWDRGLWVWFLFVFDGRVSQGVMGKRVQERWAADAKTDAGHANSKRVWQSERINKCISDVLQNPSCIGTWYVNTDYGLWEYVWQKKVGNHCSISHPFYSSNFYSYLFFVFFIQ